MTLAIYPLAGPCEDRERPLRRRFVARVKNGYPLVNKEQSLAAPDPAEDLSAKILAIADHADMDAFQSLFQSYAPRIRAYLLKLTRNAQAAEDLMQETMLAIWRKAGQYDPARGTASAWIFTIARNIWIDAWRKQRRPEIDPNDPALAAAPEPDAANQMEMRQSHDALHKAMQTLPKEQIELIRLSFFEEASHSVIAKQLGLPIGTVKSRIRLAFGRLRTALEAVK
ncbi:sigma-70 family RNA polymerase sigma factor [Devosia sp. CC-YST696]|nr:sigma-70 family RNA polymerase sigma factor [Devosia faecipullorum]